MNLEDGEPKSTVNIHLKKGTMVKVVSESPFSYISPHNGQNMYDVIVLDLENLPATSLAHTTIGCVYACEIIRVSALKQLALEGK